MKTCRVCGTSKGVSEFNIQKSSPDGLQNKCRQCASEYNKARYKDKGTEIRKKVAERVENLGGNSVLYERRRVYYQKRYQDNKEEILKRQRAYERANPHVRAGINARRRSRTVILTPLDKKKSLLWREKIKNNPCYYCNLKTEEMHYDHYFALKLGGTDHWWNIVRACSDCNWLKSARLASSLTQQ